MADSGMLSIIIPAWQVSALGSAPIEALLDSIKGSLSLPHEVIVVCNSQDPGLAEFVRTSPVVTRYCLNSTNVGVARAWNMGAHMAEGDVPGAKVHIQQMRSIEDAAKTEQGIIARYKPKYNQQGK